MGYGASVEAQKHIKKLIRHTEGPWCLLFLPNSQWAAFWFAGLECCHAEAVFERNYSASCAFVGNKDDTIEYIIQSLLKHNRRDPLNYNFNIDKIRKKLFRSNSKLNKFS